MEKSIFDEKQILAQILEDKKIGWWVKDSEAHNLVVSDFVRRQLNLSSEILPYETFIAMIREDYRDRIQLDFLAPTSKTFFDDVFPLETIDGFVWIHAKEMSQQTPDGQIVSTGYMQQIEDPEATATEQATSLRTNNLLFQLSNISHLLLSLLTTDDADAVINRILKDILKQFKAGRTYIFEYNWKASTQTCTYEAVDSNVKPEIDMLVDLPFEMNTWWTDHIKSGNSVILSTLDDLPKEADPEKEFLSIQDINSLFVVPLMSREGAWGYAGVDIVHGFHTWTKEDEAWITALFNIVGLCIQLQRSEKEVKQDKAYLQNLYEKMPLGYMRMNLIYSERNKLIDYTLMDANDSVELMYKEDISKFIGMRGSEIVPQFNEMLTLIEKALRNDNHIDTDFRFEKSGVLARLIMYSTRPGEMICLFSDITESQKKKEQLIEAKEKAEISDRLKSAFLANMSHEIRTPLNAIIGFSELLVETEEKNEKEEYFNIVQKNSELLLQLISDILDISKIEAGTLEVVNTVVDVNKLFSEVLHYYQLKTENNPVKVVFEQHMPSCFIYSDENRLTQILNNFINNALKFTTEGQISIGYYQVDRKTIKFYVKDTGTGIAKQDLDSVFHRFVKLNHFVAGTGLGLSICQSLVTQMHGEIGVESELGVGSTFWFTHPYDPNQEMPANGKDKNIQSKPEKKESSTTTTKRKPVILVAEDTESNFFLLTSIIRDKYKLIRAYNGLEAIEMYKKEKPDLILMDVSMPEMDGLTATREIRKIDWSIPIIAVTAFAFDSDKKKAIDAGCNDYMSKPIKAGKLLDKIAEYTN